LKIAIRTDASLQIGTGHVMRCLTLADALKASGAQCHFICREHPGNLIEQIRQRGFAVSILAAQHPRFQPHFPLGNVLGELETQHSAWLGSYWATDAAQTRLEVGETAVDWLIVDHYALDARWEQSLRSTCRKLMVIDDLADRQHDCDLLLDQNLGRDTHDYSRLVPEDCAVLIGPRYALLRPEFAALRDYSLRRRAIPQLRNILIAMGGVDQGDATGQVLEALKDSVFFDGTRITVVMGPHAPWLERVQSVAAQMPQPTEVKVNVNNMAQLMADSDLAIGAAGSTSWERCCLGLPTLIVVLAENQREGAVALEHSGGAKLLGGVEAIPRTLRSMLRLFTTANELRQISQASCSITDGQGASRVTAALVERHG
jgi:UDP-2,4-diacetamido-2,4,6-trideoxy-beta-L-altropyranose hydrolase